MAYSAEEQDKIIDHVCRELAKSRSLARICDEDEGTPDYDTIMRWQRSDAQLYERIADARVAGQTRLIEQIVDIADECSDDIEIVNGVPRLSKASVRRANLMIHARELQARLLAPQAFGQKIDVTSGGKALPAAGDTSSSKLEAILALAVERRKLKAQRGELIDITPEPSLDDIMS